MIKKEEAVDSHKGPRCSTLFGYNFLCMTVHNRNVDYDDEEKEAYQENIGDS